LVALVAGCSAYPKHGRWVHDVKLEGARHLDEDDVLERLATRESSFRLWLLLKFKDPVPYDEDSLALDLQRIKAIYAARGFFDAKAEKREVTLRDDKRSVAVRFAVDEGAPTRISRVAVRGHEQLPAELRRSVGRPRGLSEGDRFDNRAYEAAKRAISVTLAREGYAYARVEGQVRVHRDRRAAEIELQVQPGPVVRFGPTRLSGAEEIPADKLRRLTAWREGETYSPEVIERTRKRLLDQRVFSSVDIELPEQPTGAAAPVRIKLRPASKLRQLDVGLGVGVNKDRHEVRASLQLTWRNFLGGLRTLSSKVRPALVFLPAYWDVNRWGPALDAEALRLTQPDLLGTGLVLSGMGGYDLGVTEGYRFHGPRGQLTLERGFLDDRLHTGLAWNTHYLDFFDIDDEVFDPNATPLGPGFQESYWLTWFEPFVRLDLTNDPFNPEIGLLAELRLEAPGIAGDYSYLKVTPELRGFIPLGTRRVVLALRAMFGAMWAVEGDETPGKRRYTLGQPKGHRGFGVGRLSPQTTEQRIPLGGNAAVLLSGDLRIGVWSWKGWGVGLASFVDLGDVETELQHLSLERLHTAVGGSLMIKTPAGPIVGGVGVRLNRLEELTGGRPNPDPGERIAWHLSFGTAF
jgi:outer membrane protein assembly factor BamA